MTPLVLTEPIAVGNEVDTPVRLSLSTGVDRILLAVAFLEQRASQLGTAVLCMWSETCITVSPPKMKYLSIVVVISYRGKVSGFPVA